MHPGPELWILLERVHDDSLRRGRRASAGHGRRRLGKVLRDHGIAGRCLEGRRAGKHLVDDRRERIDIRLLGHRRSANLLGREILRRDVLRRGRAEETGQLHVHELDPAIGEDHHVAGAESAVDEADVVERLDRAAETDCPASRPPDVEGPAPGHGVAQKAALEELHDRVGLTGLGLPELQDSDEPRVARRRGGDRPPHALDRADDVARGGELAREESDRDALRGRLVFGDAHGPEGAGPQLTDDPVATPNPPADVRAFADVTAHAGASAELVPASVR